MNRRAIPLRWVLAVFGTASFLALWFSVRTTWNPWSPFGQYIVAPRRLAIALNAPAYLLAGIVSESLGYNPYKGDVARAFVCFMTPSVFMIWFRTGRWFDRNIGSDAAKPKSHSRLRLVGICLLFTVQLLVVYRCIYFVTGGTAGWHGETPVHAAWTYGFALWLFVWQFMAVSSWRRSRTN